MWTLSQDITGLLLAIKMKYTFTNSLIYLLTYEFRETSWRGLTADSWFLIAMDCGRGSLIKLWGPYVDHSLMIRTLLLTGQHRHSNSTAGHSRSSPVPPSSSALTGRMLSGQSTKTNKAASDVIIEAHVVMSFECVEWRDLILSPTGRWLAVYSRPFRRHQSNDHLWDNYRCSAMFVRVRFDLLCTIV